MSRALNLLFLSWSFYAEMWLVFFNVFIVFGVTNQESCLIFIFLKKMYVFSTLLLLPYCSRERTRKIKTIKHHIKGSFVAKLIKPVSYLRMPLGGGSWFSQQHRNPCLVRADVETETSSELKHTEC